MKRRLLSLFLACVMALGMLPVTALAVPVGNTGEYQAVSLDTPASDGGAYQIGTADDLMRFARQVNGGESGISGVLTADIDLSDVPDWPGIGTDDHPFSGSFDGQGHTVTFKEAGVGLFGVIMGSKNALASVRNTVTAGSVKNSGFAREAGFVHFTMCVNRATITYSGSYVAGLVGIVGGVREAGILKSNVLFTNCGNEASVSGGGGNVGGILGYSMTNTRLNGCYNTGKIHGNHHVGGLVGYLQGADGTCSISNCYNTGTVTGTSEVGGILGYMKNGVSIANCYNSGAATYAIAGKRYDHSAKIINSYYLGIASAKCSPDYNETTRFDELTSEIATRATAKSASEMASAAFAELLGDAFVQSCPAPVLTWQDAVEHTGTVCENCALGSTEKEIYDVSFQIHDGYTLKGENKATQGGAYTFTVTITEGYERATDFTVKVNGKALTAASDGKYTVLNVDGPLSVTVQGVQLIPGNHAIQLPAEDYGYRIAGDKTVKRDADYTFTLTFIDGFREGKNFRVFAQQILSQELLDKGYLPEEVELTGNHGVYTIPAVSKDYRILVEGVEVVSSGVTATISLTITEGENKFHVAPNSEEIVMDMTFEVPYFDLSVYGLERYYYNPYCYVDEAGNLRGIQQKGTPESAYDKITIMHAFIVATELYYLEYGPDEVGKGISYEANPELFQKAISWSQSAGSSFMDFWDFGTNLNYYLNYVYPLGYPGWGATSDQIPVADGDVISVHMITGNASGSRFGFFSVNDSDKVYTESDVIDSIEVSQGEKVELTLFWTSTTGDYSTGYELMANKEIYWIDGDDFTEDVRDWNRTNFGNTPVAKLVTDSKGTVTISTVGLEPGVYYLAALGGWTKGGAVDNGGFVSAGGETGPAVFKLTVLEYHGKLGDVNGDSQITSFDAALILQYVAKLTSEVNESVADVNGDGQVTSFDAALILQYVAKIIDAFPGENG